MDQKLIVINEKHIVTEEYTAESYSKRSELNDMKQHADKIIQGIKGLTEKDSKRAIWELFQNAIDISENCEVIIKLTDEAFTFEHNGEPFNPNTLDSLFKQVSSKTLEEAKLSYEEGEPVGQYGTGFITTHQFGRIVEISGSLKRSGGFVSLNNFRIDRTTSSWSDLSDEIYNLKKQVEELLKKDPYAEEPIKTTSFKYLLETESNKERAKKAVESLPGILPYVMVLNKRLKRVTVVNKYGEETVYSKSAGGYNSDVQEQILINNKVFNIEYLNSNRLTVILPLNSNKESIYLNDDLPRLFLYYPLIGTEKFGMNFIFHTRNFLPTEPRDGLYLKSSNENNKIEEDANRSLIEEASEMIFEYIRNNDTLIVNPEKFAKIYFKTDSDDTELNVYFKELKKLWIDHVTEFLLVDTPKERISASKAVFLNSEMIEDICDESFDAIYSIASKFYHNIPSKSIVKEWTIIVNEWNRDDINYIGFDELTTLIADKSNLEKFEVSELKLFYQTIIEKGHDGLFSSKKLLPNIKGEFRKTSDLNKSVDLPNVLIEIADVINPDISKKQIDPNFMFTIPLEAFGRKAYTTQINAAIEEKMSRESRGIELEAIYLENLVSLSSITTSKDSVSTPLLIVEDICEYYKLEYSQIIIEPNENKEDELSVTSTQRRLLRCFLNDIKKEDKDWVEENNSYLFKVLKKIVEYSAYEEIYKSFSIFPNQLNGLRILSDLDIDGTIPSDIKNLYDKVIQPSYPIRSNLLNQTFNSIHKLGKIRKTNSLTGEIENKFFGDHSLVDVSKHDFRSEILKIIQLFNSSEKSLEGDIDKSKAYQLYFPRLNAIKINILAQLADGDDSFKILSLDKESIKHLAEIGSNPDLLKIIELGKEALERQKQEDSDLAHKKEIGTHLEYVLSKELESFIPGNIRANIEGVQNGQDIIIFIDEIPVYYIEVKSKWNINTQIRLSKNQTIRAYKEKLHYSLCTIDMVNYIGEDRYKVSGMEKIKDLVKFNNDIGSKVEHLIETFEQEVNIEEFYLDGEVRTNVPRKYIEEGIELSSFQNYLIDYLRDNYGN